MARPVDEAQRAVRRAQILGAARDHLTDHGLDGFSLREVARRVGMAPNSLYNHFPRLDDLITELLVEAFEGLESALRDAAARPPAAPSPWTARFVALVLAYRDWAVTHPTDYDLIFGRPVPGYVAPVERTEDLGVRTFAAGLDVLRDADRAGALEVPTAYADPVADRDEAIRRAMVVVWSRMHGLVLLEIHGHLGHVVPDPAALYARAAVALTREVGITG